MAITSESTFLCVGTTTGDAMTYKKLMDIKEFPDLGSAPDTIDVTTLSDHFKKSLNDLPDPGNLEFSANYDQDDYDLVVSYNDDKIHSWCIAFGEDSTGTPDGHNGAFTFEGYLVPWAKGAGVSASVDMGFSIAMTTDPEHHNYKTDKLTFEAGQAAKLAA